MTAPLSPVPFRSRIRALVRALRLHQWAKNVLIAVPVAAAHRVDDAGAWLDALVSFLAFGLVASAVYVVNDLLDVEVDRRHPRKRHRPFASGTLPGGAGLLLVPVLLAGGAALASALPGAFGVLLAGYFGVSLAYSLDLKKRVLVDVLVLAALYTSRIFAGGLATGIPVSEWLASFSMFLFLSLAFLKRASELADATAVLPGRGYLPVDRESVFMFGIGSGYLAVVVLALYVSGDEVARLYAHPQWVWALCPLVLFWVSRLWLGARRGVVDDDPLLYAMKDRVTWMVAGVGALVLFIAS